MLVANHGQFMDKGRVVATVLLIGLHVTDVVVWMAIQVDNTVD